MGLSWPLKSGHQNISSLQKGNLHQYLESTQKGGNPFRHRIFIATQTAPRQGTQHWKAPLWSTTNIHNRVPEWLPRRKNRTHNLTPEGLLRCDRHLGSDYEGPPTTDRRNICSSHLLTFDWIILLLVYRVHYIFQILIPSLTWFSIIFSHSLKCFIRSFDVPNFNFHKTQYVRFLFCCLAYEVSVRSHWKIQHCEAFALCF